MRSYCRVAACYKSMFWSAVRYLVYAATPLLTVQPQEHHFSVLFCSFMEFLRQTQGHSFKQKYSILFFQRCSSPSRKPICSLCLCKNFTGTLKVAVKISSFCMVLGSACISCHLFLGCSEVFSFQTCSFLLSRLI